MNRIPVLNSIWPGFLILVVTFAHASAQEPYETSSSYMYEPSQQAEANTQMDSTGAPSMVYDTSPLAPIPEAPSTEVEIDREPWNFSSCFEQVGDVDYCLAMWANSEGCVMLETLYANRTRAREVFHNACPGDTCEALVEVAHGPESEVLEESTYVLSCTSTPLAPVPRGSTQSISGYFPPAFIDIDPEVSSGP